MERGLRRTLFLTLCIITACASPPREIDPARQTPAKQALAGQATKEDLSAFIGASPVRCVTSSATSELCQWEAGGRQRGWQVLARAIGTGDWITVVAFPRRVGLKPTCPVAR